MDFWEKDIGLTEQELYERRWSDKADMKKLFQQMIKFGMVGAFCFVIDYAVTVVLYNFLGIHYLITSTLGFVISVVFNYFLSFRFVFQRKENLNRKLEFVIFVFLSVVGLVLNEILMYVGVEIIYVKWKWIQNMLPQKYTVAIVKIFATGVVMVYNFVTRKLFLERKESNTGCEG